MNFNWFSSRSVRLASDMSKHARKLLAAQRDILSQQAIKAVEDAINELDNAIATGAPEDQLKKRMTDLENAANKWLKPYPHAGIRENVEVLLVALAVAMAIRTFIVQPFKIPSGSMQPTLFGITQQPIPADEKIPGAVARFFDYWIHGNSYFNIPAPADGQLTAVKKPFRVLLFNLWQEYQFNEKWDKVWFPADELFQRAGYHASFDNSVVDPRPLKKDDPIIRLKVLAGDHLFVDRISYNFRHPKRGEIIVFETTGIPRTQGDFYIKRLVALSDEKVQIGDDRHLVIDGKRLDKDTPHFENVYSFSPSKPPHESQYSGHLNNYVATEYQLVPPGYDLAPNFPNESSVFQVRPEHYMVMGDNTCNSSDSRVWGDFPRTNVIGKYFFVYWPFSDRWGWNVK